VLKVEHLNKKFVAERSVDAVEDVTFSLEGGEFLAVVGRSGSGKSTLLGMLGGISQPTSGSVTIDDVEQWSLSDDAHANFRNEKVGFVFQFASLLPALRAIDNVALPALISGHLDYNAAYSRAHQLLKHIGLSERFDSYPGQLSGGEQRRVAIARALINSPSVVLADEPTADLDEETESEILNLLIDIHRAFKLTLIVVTHNPAIAQRADKIMQMQKGKIVSYENTNLADKDKPPNLETAPNLEIAPNSEIAPNFETPAASQTEGALKNIYLNPPENVSAEHVSLGAGLERMIGRLVLFVVPTLLIVYGLNFLVAQYQTNLLEAKESKRLELEDLAMRGLRADVDDITMTDDGKYVVSIYLQNTTSGKDLYVMSPVVRGFVQVGTNWQEVPLTQMDSHAPKILKITSKQVCRYIMKPDVASFTQLFPFYMHVRITDDMVVSPSDQPKTDLVERNDSYYVYLKPHDAVDSMILKKMKFPGKPPVWIPMPPH
jgi:ABC-type lipoprotein export system ATPase subunit